MLTKQLLTTRRGDRRWTCCLRPKSPTIADGLDRSCPRDAALHCSRTVLHLLSLFQAKPIVAGIGTPPQLHGYVSTTEKEIAQVFIRSHKEEPILAGWNFGLGKLNRVDIGRSTCMVQKRGFRGKNFGKFWGQVVNWTLPTTDTDTDFDLSVSLRHGIAHISIDTRTPSQAA